MESILQRVKHLTQKDFNDREVAQLRVIVVSLLTVTSAFVGYLLFPVESQSSDASAQAPIISVVSDKESITSASIHSITLTNISAYIRLSVTTGPSDANIYVVISGPKFGSGNPARGWTVSPWDKTLAFTKIPLRKEREYQNLEVSASFSSCNCFQYKAPYLYASSASYDDAAAAIFASQDNIHQWPSKFYKVRMPQVEKSELDLTDAGFPTTWDTVDASPFPPAQVTDDWWSWADSNYGNVRLRSVDDASNSEHQVFWAGLLLGVAGAGLFLVIDSLFSLLAMRRGRRQPISPDMPVPKTVPRRNAEDEEVSGHAENYASDASAAGSSDIEERPAEFTHRSESSQRVAIWAAIGLGAVVAARSIRRFFGER
ncbi:hypothetical protein ABZ770_02250 [Streptomyces sp. NPDC006654]|uniref:hypothetical protein n=1 Tax=Streptomyces sp. NPDC006654 TaxID=3156897 RepID=UPI0033E83373